MLSREQASSPSGELTHHIADVGDRVGDIQLHYVRAGSGDLVLLLHGWPQTGYMWRKIMGPLAKHYTVVAPDLRGFGQSSKPIDGYDKQTVARDLYQLVKQLGFHQLFLVGHDLGGPTAYAYASAHPADVRRLVILDAALTIDDTQSLGHYERLFHLSFNQEPDLAIALISGRERIFLSHFFRDCANPAAFSQADIDEYVSCFSAPGAMRGGMAHYAAKDTDLEQRKRMAQTKLEMPVLALGGAASFRSGVLRSCQRVATDVRGGIVEGSGHWIAEEQPEELTRQLLAFFAGESDSA